MSPLTYGAHFAASNFLNTEIILEIGQYLNWGPSFFPPSIADGLRVVYKPAVRKQD